MLARNSANANLATNLKDYVKDSMTQPLVFEQIKAILMTIVLAVVGTVIIAYVVKADRRPPPERRSRKPWASTWPSTAKKATTAPDSVGMRNLSRLPHQ